MSTLTHMGVISGQGGIFLFISAILTGIRIFLKDSCRVLQRKRNLGTEKVSIYLDEYEPEKNVFKDDLAKYIGNSKI